MCKENTLPDVFSVSAVETELPLVIRDLDNPNMNGMNQKKVVCNVPFAVCLNIVVFIVVIFLNLYLLVFQSWYDRRIEDYLYHL